MATLKELLSIPRFSDLKLLNKHADLDRIVDTIEISETPDVSGYLPKNALLLTTAMAFEDDPKGLCDLISSLNVLPSAGIAIKLGRFITELDPEVIKVADELKFPIIQIPMSTTLGDISHKLLSYIWDNHTELMYFALDIQRKFSSMMMKGATADSLINHLSSLIKRPILLFNSFGEIQTSSRGFKLNDLINDRDWQDLLGQIRTIQKNPKNTTLLKDIGNESKLLVTIFPISNDHFYPHLLVILKADQLPYPFSQLAIEQAITVLSYSIYRDKMLLATNRSSKKEFFQKITDKHIEENSEINNWIDYGKNFGIIKANTYRIIIGEIHIPKVHEYYAEEIQQLIYEWFQEFQKYSPDNMVLFPTNNSKKIALLTQKKENKLPQLLEKIHKQLLNHIEIPVYFGIGNPVNDIRLIRFSYSEAEKALNEKRKDEIVHYYENQGIRSLVDNLPDEEIHYFCLSTLKELAYPETEHDKELRKTLTTYLDTQCKITDTADELFIHRNTVKYRIAKCAQIFGKDIHHPELSLQLRVALLLSEAKNTILP